MNKDLFRTALTYVERGYSWEDLRWGYKLYNATPEDIEECRDYYDEIQEKGTFWAYEQIKEE